MRHCLVHEIRGGMQLFEDSEINLIELLVSGPLTFKNLKKCIILGRVPMLQDLLVKLSTALTKSYKIKCVFQSIITN